MQLTKIIDPRDAMTKARKTDMIRFAKEQGIKEIHPGMQGETMKAILRDKGITRIPIANPQTLGAGHTRQTDRPPALQQTVDVEALQRRIDELTALVKSQQVEPPKEKPVSEIIQLRRECKARGIKFARTDKLADLRAKLDGTPEPA